MEQLPGRMVSVKKGWTYRTRGYAPLIVSLANTKEVLSLVNRPGNRPSHDGCVEWIEQAIKLVKPYARKVCVRGDTDYSLTTHFDRWSEDSDFVFGMDASAALKGRAGALTEGAWKERKRKPKYTIKTWERDKPENEKERIVKGRGYKNIYLEREHVAEFDYRPVKCNNSYRVVALRKTLSVKEGQMKLYDDVRYFFYITTKRNISALEVVQFANGRCDQENVIEQLKNGVNAMEMPVRDLESNWSYMVMAALAWNLKAWFGLLMPNRMRGMQVIKMEFRRFLNTLILIPCQITRTGRKIVYRILCYNDWLKDLLSTWERVRKLKTYRIA